MNRVVLMGRLARDPDVRYSQSDPQMAIARYTLAVDRRKSRNQQEGQQTADFISCKAFGKAAEFVQNYLHKGTKICVSGRIQTGSYTMQDGTKVYTTEVVVEEHEFAESKNSQNAAPQETAGETPAQPQGSANSAAQRPTGGGYPGFMDIPDNIDEELPFT